MDDGAAGRLINQAWERRKHLSEDALWALLCHPEAANLFGSLLHGLGVPDRVKLEEDGLLSLFIDFERFPEDFRKSVILAVKLCLSRRYSLARINHFIRLLPQLYSFKTIPNTHIREMGRYERMEFACNNYITWQPGIIFQDNSQPEDYGRCVFHKSALISRVIGRKNLADISNNMTDRVSMVLYPRFFSQDCFNVDSDQDWRQVKAEWIERIEAALMRDGFASMVRIATLPEALFILFSDFIEHKEFRLLGGYPVFTDSYYTNGERAVFWNHKDRGPIVCPESYVIKHDALADKDGNNIIRGKLMPLVIVWEK